MFYIVACWAVGGRQGAFGAGLGVAIASFSVWTLSRIVWLLGLSAEAQKPPRTGAFLTVFAFLMKVPAYGVCIAIAAKLSDPGPGCFALGILLVYSAATGWAVWASRSPQPDV